MGASSNGQLVAPPQYAAVPAELLARPQWTVWKRVTKPGAAKATKVPYSARTGSPASTTGPDTWATFEEAANAAAANEAYAGVGFVFTEADPYVGIDLDNCIDSESGELTAEAKRIVAAMASYTERTPSGKGLHIIVRGKLPVGGRKKGNIEMYDTGRYFTMTGDSWPETNCAVENRTAELCALHEEVFGRPGRASLLAPKSPPQVVPQIRPTIRS